jgi:hypothetical protein
MVRYWSFKLRAPLNSSVRPRDSDIECSQFKETTMSHVFISYVRENAAQVDKLREVLRANGISVWLDRYNILPGHRWQDVIRKAIKEGSFFLACFSEEYLGKDRSYMNEELGLAIEELRRRPVDRAWFIPVLLSECEPPDRSIGGGDTLNSIQQVLLYQDWKDGVRRILSVVAPEVEAKIDVPSLETETAPWEKREAAFPPLKNSKEHVVTASLEAEAHYIIARVGRRFSASHLSMHKAEFYLQGAPLPEEILTQLKSLENKYGIPVNVLEYVDRGFY